jgi:uncharacterized protein YkwD
VLALLAVAVIHLVNAERVRHHEQPLKVSPALEREARAHTGPVNTRVRSCGGAWGQNVAWGSLKEAGPRAIVRAWMRSPEHRQNLLDRQYRFTGVGVVVSGPETFFTQDFCSVREAA